MAIEKKPSVNNTFNKKQKFIDAAMARAYIEDCDKRLKRSRIGL